MPKQTGQYTRKLSCLLDQNLQFQPVILSVEQVILVRSHLDLAGIPSHRKKNPGVLGPGVRLGKSYMLQLTVALNLVTQSLTKYIISFAFESH